MIFKFDPGRKTTPTKRGPKILRLLQAIKIVNFYVYQIKDLLIRVLRKYTFNLIHTAGNIVLNCNTSLFEDSTMNSFFV